MAWKPALKPLWASREWEFNRRPRDASYGDAILDHEDTVGEEGLVDNFVKGAKWSPDGTCVMTNSEDNALRVFDVPMLDGEGGREKDVDLCAVLKIKKGEVIYDFAWYPLMDSMNPATCCAICSVRDGPMHLVDCYDGSLRATYGAYNHLDEVTTAMSVQFGTPIRFASSEERELGGEEEVFSGLWCDKLFSGYENCVRIFDISRPGRECTQTFTTVKCNKQWSFGQRGIISCFAMSPTESIFAAGCYDRTVGIYDVRTNALMHLLANDHLGGVTHVQFTPCGRYILSGARKDGKLICTDVRNMDAPLFQLERRVDTHQRVLFDIDPSGSVLASGNQGGSLVLYDLKLIIQTAGLQETEMDNVRKSIGGLHGGNCVNSVGFNPRVPGMLMTASGQRHLEQWSSDSESDSEEEEEEGGKKSYKRVPKNGHSSPLENSVRIWTLELQ
eukprot:Nk52_evm19s967 gene=Nk52_evmTU19s967